MTIDITSPSAGGAVGWSFNVSGTYDLSVGQEPGPGASPGTIVVTVYESDGTTPLPNTTVLPATIILRAGIQSGIFLVAVTHDANYSGAVITAVLTPTGGTPASDSVSNVTISQ